MTSLFITDMIRIVMLGILAYDSYEFRKAARQKDWPTTIINAGYLFVVAVLFISLCVL